MGESAQLSHTDRVMLIGSDHLPANADTPNEIISESWKRCLNQFGLHPTQDPEGEVIESARLSERRELMHDFISVAHGECQNLHKQISQSGYVIALTDAQGVVIEQMCDPSLEKVFRDSGLTPGSVWSEERRGTNGMGTALQIAAPVIVHREDHFFNSNLDLTCTSSPIMNPHGEIAGILDVSALDMKGSWQSQIHTRALVQMAANFIEYHYFQKYFQDSILLRFHPRSEFLGVK